MTINNWRSIGVFQAYDYNLGGTGLADGCPPREPVIANKYAAVLSARYDRCNFWRPFNTAMDVLFYVHANLDWGTALWQNSQSMAWWLTNNPTQILYKIGANDHTQQSQVANPFYPNDTEIALDFTNVAVETYLATAWPNLNVPYTENLVPAAYIPPVGCGTNSSPYSSYAGANPGQYTGIFMDNVSLDNVGAAALKWNGTTFISVGSVAWTGAANDYNYAKDMAAHVGRMNTKIKALNPPMKLIINLDEGHVAFTDTLMTTLMNDCDGIWYEKGFTTYGTALRTGTDFDNVVKWIQSYPAAFGKLFLLQHTFLYGGGQSEREFGLACYLLVKYPLMSLSMVPLRSGNVPDYGVEHWYTTEYSTPIGTPTENANIANGVYKRQYTNGIVLVNYLNAGIVDYVLPSGVEYIDNYGNIFSGTIQLDSNQFFAKVLIVNS